MRVQDMASLRPTLKLVSVVASVLVIFVGCLVLIGWALDIDVLKRIVPGLNAMNPATALAFILAGLSLLLLRDERADQKRRLGQLCALVVALIGLLKLVEVLFGWSLGVDQLLFRDKLSLGSQVPNRIGSITALNLFLLGSALLLLDARIRRGFWLAQYLALAALFTTWLPILGYV
jgi:hypothetical protein